MHEFEVHFFVPLQPPSKGGQERSQLHHINVYFVACPPSTSYSDSFPRPKLGRDTCPQPGVFNQIIAGSLERYALSANVDQRHHSVL